MAFDFGTFTEFDDSNTVGDPVVLAAAKAIKLTIFKGVLWGMMGAPQFPLTQKDFEVYSRSKTAQSGTTGVWDISATTALPLLTGYEGLTVGHVLKIESEVVIVKTVDKAAKTISVFGRGLGGTTAATHASASVYDVKGFAGKDADLKDVESLFESSLKYTNYAQTVFETLDWEKGAELARKGVENGNIVPLLREEALYRQAGMLSNMAVGGYKQLGTSTIPYMSAGLLSQLADTSGSTRPILDYNVSGAFSETKLIDALEEVFSVGSPDTIFCSMKNKTIIDAFNRSASNVQVGVAMASREAGQFIDTYNYQGSLLNVLVDADMPDDKIAVVTMSSCKKQWLLNDALTEQEEPAPSSRERRTSIQGTIAFSIEGVGYEHILLYGITHA